MMTHREQPTKTRKCKGRPNVFSSHGKEQWYKNAKRCEARGDYACVQWWTGKKAETVPNIRYGRRPDKQEREVVYVFRASMETEQRERSRSGGGHEC